MNVILLEKVGKLGAVGDKASVKAGYARNFLFPTGKAIPATRSNLESFEARRAELLAAHNEKVAAAQGRAAKLKDLRVAISVNAGEEGRLFGSIGTRDIDSMPPAITRFSQPERIFIAAIFTASSPEAQKRLRTIPATS